MRRKPSALNGMALLSHSTLLVPKPPFLFETPPKIGTILKEPSFTPPPPQIRGRFPRFAVFCAPICWILGALLIIDSSQCPCVFLLVWTRCFYLHGLSYFWLQTLLLAGSDRSCTFCSSPSDHSKAGDRNVHSGI